MKIVHYHQDLCLKFPQIDSIATFTLKRPLYFELFFLAEEEGRKESSGRASGREKGGAKEEGESPF